MGSYPFQGKSRDKSLSMPWGYADKTNYGAILQKKGKLQQNPLRISCPCTDRAYKPGTCQKQIILFQHTSRMFTALSLPEIQLQKQTPDRHRAAQHPDDLFYYCLLYYGCLFVSGLFIWTGSYVQACLRHGTKPGRVLALNTPPLILKFIFIKA